MLRYQLNQLEERLPTMHAAAFAKLWLESERMKTRYDHRANSGSFQEGDLVWLYLKIPLYARAHLNQSYIGAIQYCKKTQ